MLKYSIKRLLLLIPVLLGVTFIIYAAMNLSGTDYVDSLITEDMTEEQVAALRAHYGLDKPRLERLHREDVPGRPGQILQQRSGRLGIL